jgi:hypothetical protein
MAPDTLPFLVTSLLVALGYACLCLKGRVVEMLSPSSVWPRGDEQDAPLTLVRLLKEKHLLPPMTNELTHIQNFTIRIGSHSIPAVARQLVEAPVFEAQLLSSASRHRLSTILDRYILPRLLPLRLQRSIRQTFPMWFLPAKFIVKALDPTNPATFIAELNAYTILQHLQGRLIPIHYGIAEIKHTGRSETQMAHLLEFVEGLPLSECTEEQSRDLRTEEKMEEAYALLNEKGLVQGDAAPRHFIHTRSGDLRIIDFGEAYMARNAAELNRGDARDAMYWFSRKHVRKKAFIMKHFV